MKKLNTKGFSHDIVLVLIVVVVAIAGVGYLVASHADSCTPVSGPTSSPTSGSSTVCPVSSPTSSPVSSSSQPAWKTYMTVSPKNITATVSRSNAQNGLIYGPSIDITGLVSTSFRVVYPANAKPDSKGLHIISAELSPGQTIGDPAFLSATDPNGTYSGTVQVQPYSNEGVWLKGPTITYSLKLTN